MDENDTFPKNIQKVLLVIHRSFLHAKQLLLNLSSESQKFFANLVVLGLMPVNLTLVDLSTHANQF